MSSTDDPVVSKTASGSLLGRGRDLAFYGVIGLTAVISVLVLPELLVNLVTGWTGDGAAELGTHRLHVMGLAAFVAIVLVGVFAQVYRPEQRVGALIAAFVGVLVSTTMAVVAPGAPVEEIATFAVLTGLLLVLHPAGRKSFSHSESYSPALAGLAAVAAIPLLAFAGSEAASQIAGETDHAAMGHYGEMAALAATIVALGLVAAAGIAGWRIAAWMGGTLATVFGAMSVAFPAQASSLGVTGGALLIAWAIAFVAVAEFSRTSGASRLFRRPSGTGREHVDAAIR